MQKTFLLVDDLISRQNIKEKFSKTKEFVYIKNKEEIEQKRTPDLVILDLTTNPSKLDSYLKVLKEMNLIPKVVAFYPHVRIDLKENAKKNGIRKILPRSKFFSLTSL